MKKIIITPGNVEEVDLTTEEIAVVEANDITREQALKDEEEVKTAKATKKASGKQKLKDLGLDDDEIQALMGA
jgi:hypothetical protein